MRDFETGLTWSRLKELLRYDPATGKWIWLGRFSAASRVVIGAEAGSLSSHGYAVVTVGGFQYKSHRLAHFYMTGEWPSQTIDHEDLGRANNRWTNIRPATRQENGRNYPRLANNTTGFKCVSFDKRRGKYRAHIYVDKRQKWLGYHDTAEQAHAVYKAEAERIFGKFARAA